MLYTTAQPTQGRHRPDQACHSEGAYMQETQVMPLSRFGDVEWVHRFS